MNITTLIDQNPWWKEKEKIEEDYNIIKWREKKHKWVPEILDKISLKPFSLNILVGPRQVGKTTAVKLLIKRLLKEKNEKSIFYFNCEEISDYKELSQIINIYLEFKEENEITSSFIILDEITSPKEWYRSIKFLIDQGRFKNDVLLLTGSSSIAIKRQSELFPGRRGYGKDLVLWPLSFREFIKVIDPKLYKKVEKYKLNSFDEINKKAVNLMVYFKELDKLLKKYFVYGGFPLSIASLDKTTEEAKITYLNWIKTAILKSDRSDIIARQIIKSVIEKMPSTISWEGVSRDIEIKSPKTVSAYMELFKSMFATIILYNVDISKKRIRFGKNKKVHVIDPLLLEIFEEWCFTKIKNKESILAESLVVSHLNRLYKDKVFFWKNGFEIDALVLNKNKFIGFEVKWSNRPRAKSLPQLEQFVIITKKDFSIKDQIKIPLSVFLALLNI